MLDNNLADWDIPVTDEFVTRIQRGVRRRRRLRAAAAGAAVLAVTAIATTAIAWTRQPKHATPLARPPAMATSIGPSLDGFQITQLPAGATRTGEDSARGMPVDKNGPNPNIVVPMPGVAWVTDVTTRRFDRGVGIPLFVAVYRPNRLNPDVGTALAAWAERGAATRAGEKALINTFDTPAGPARLVATVGSEVTAYEVVITAPGNVIIVISANAAFSAEELTEVARGITT